MSYDAFISYSHVADGKLAPAVQAGLARLARPWYRIRALRVFRDETGLAVNPHLWGSIETALDESDYFVLLASPESAASPWVAREIEHWKATKPVERILPVLTDGDLVWDSATGAYDLAKSTALPAALATAYVAEPRHLDLRWARTEAQLDLRHARFRAAIAGLAAPMHGVSRDELEGEDVRQHRRALRLAWGAAALLLLVTVAAVISATFAVGYASTARANERRALDATARARRNATEATHQRTLAVQNAGAAHSAQATAEANATEASQNAAVAAQSTSEAQAQRTRAEQNAVDAANNAARAGANGREAVRQSAAAQRNAAEATANAVRASANATQAQASAQAATKSAAQAVHAAQVASAQRARAVASAAVARRRRAQAVASATVARSRQLAATALNIFGSNPDRATLFSVQGDRFQSNAQAQDSLMRTIQREPEGLLSYVPADPTIGETHVVLTSPDGRLLATIGSSGRVALRDLAANRALAAPAVTSLATSGFPGAGFSPDGRWLVVQTASTLVVWDTTTGRTVTTVAAGFGPVSAIDARPDLGLLAVVAADGIHTLPVGTTAGGAAAPIALPSGFSASRVALSADGGLVAVAGLPAIAATQTHVLVLDRAGTSVADLPADEGICLCLGSRGGFQLAFGSDAGGATLFWAPLGSSDLALVSWRVGSWTRIRAVPLNVGPGETVVAVDPGLTRVATADTVDGDVRIRDLASGALLGVPFAADFPFCPDCSGFVVGSDQLAFGADGRLLVEGTDRLLRTFSPDGVGERLVERKALASFPGGGGVISADGRVLASITADGSTAELLDATTGRSLSTIAGLPPQSTAMLALSPDGTKVAVLSAHFVTDPFQSHMIAAVYDTATGRALWSVETDLFFASGATFDPSGSMLAIVGANSTTFNAPVAIELLDATSGARLGTPVSVAPFASAPQFSADGRLIAVVNGAFGPSQGPVLYGVAEHRVVRTLGDPRLADISTFQFSADGKTAIAVSNDTGHVYVLDATTFAIRSDFDTGAGGGSVFALNADGSHLAVVSANALQIFDTATGQTIGAPVASTDVRAIAFADDDTTLVGFSGAGLERIDVDVTSWSGQACTIAGRNLTRAEWTAALGSDVPYQSTCPALPPGP